MWVSEKIMTVKELKISKKSIKLGNKTASHVLLLMQVCCK